MNLNIDAAKLQTSPDMGRLCGEGRRNSLKASLLLSYSCLGLIVFVPLPSHSSCDRCFFVMCLQGKKGEKKPITERDTNMVRTWYEHDTKKTSMPLLVFLKACVLAAPTTKFNI